MNVDKICRCCLTNDGPLLTIYDGGTTNDCLAAMINKITGVKPEPNDKLPDKACLLCIRELKDFYAFKIKCENSHRTLQQLFLDKVEVQLCSSLKNDIEPTKVAKEDVDAINLGKYEMTPVEDAQIEQMKVDIDYSHSVNFTSNVESAIPNTYVNNCLGSSGEETISVPTSPISFKNSFLPIETITHLENYEQKPSTTTDTMENPYKNEFPDSETDSCDSIEFISERPQANEPIVVLEEFCETYNTNPNTEVNNAEVEYTFNNVSSPQWVPEEEIYISLVNEDININNVQRPSNEPMEVVAHYPKHVDISSESRYQCALCGRALKHKRTLINHLKTHEKPYSCRFCESLFNDYFNLQMHLMVHSNNSHGQSKLLITGSNTHERSELLTGSNAHGSNAHEQSELLITGSTTHEQSELLTTVSTPQNREKPKNFACDLCPKLFRCSSSLNNHRRTHTGEKPFKCRYCDKTFIQTSTRSNHEKTHTGVKAFKCQYCDKTFVQRGSCTMHERVHTGEKPYKCQYCHRGFIQLSIKVRHEETHKRSDIKCPQCHVNFPTSSDVLEHFKTQHT